VASANRSFRLLAFLSCAVLATIAWSTHHLLLAGAPAVAEGMWPGVGCLLVPALGDVAPHAASYLFLAAIIGGSASGARAVLRQQRQTQALLRACRAGLQPPDDIAEAAARAAGIVGRVDVLDVPVPLAFCYGYLRPRILFSRGLLGWLSREQLTALLLHEREHLRQRDPIKIAVGRLLSSTVFFIPIVAALYRKYMVEKELAADAAAIAAQGSPSALASALAVLLEFPRGGRPEAAAGADEALDARIDALLGQPVRIGPRLGGVPLVGSVVVAVLAVLPLVLAPPPAAASLVGRALESGCHLASDARPPLAVSAWLNR
jgi:Zn-dependent protease with chaperone function